MKYFWYTWRDFYYLFKVLDVVSAKKKQFTLTKVLLVKSIKGWKVLLLTSTTAGGAFTRFKKTRKHVIRSLDIPF